MKSEKFFQHLHELETWFEQNHSSSSGLWVVYYKKSSKNASFSYEEIVETALCYGWIDSLPGKVNEERTKIYVSPRNPTSSWSLVNKHRVQRLILEGRMTVAGQKTIDLAKENGAWARLDNLELIPKDLDAQLGKTGKQFFEAFPKSIRLGILEWLLSAKTEKTRLKRIDEIAKSAQLGEKPPSLFKQRLLLKKIH